MQLGPLCHLEQDRVLSILLMNPAIAQPLTQNWGVVVAVVVAVAGPTIPRKSKGPAL